MYLFIIGLITATLDFVSICQIHKTLDMPLSKENVCLLWPMYIVCLCETTEKLVNIQTTRVQLMEKSLNTSTQEY